MRATLLRGLFGLFYFETVNVITSRAAEKKVQAGIYADRVTCRDIGDCDIGGSLAPRFGESKKPGSNHLLSQQQAAAFACLAHVRAG
jgi:hypothetical protein